MADPSATERHDIEQLADAFMADYRAGKSPCIDEYVQKYPELAGELEDLLKALLLLEQNSPQHDSSGTSPYAAGPRTLPSEIGDYLIIREIGRGGMGVVYEAVQNSLGRHVALKVLSSPGLLNPSHLERFRLEARAAARLHHSHIVPVFGVGESDGLSYYAMQFIQGQSLDLVIDALRTFRSGKPAVPSQQDDDRLTHSVVDKLLTGEFRQDVDSDDSNAHPREACAGAQPETPSDATSQAAIGGASPFAEGSDRGSPGVTQSTFTSSHGGREYYRSVARVGLQVADALAYAHSEGILHRDIKPSNLLLDAKANVWITDFGLAKLEDTDGLTQTGDFVGTLRYMAPERLEGWSDRRSDIYSLGATLYELVTLRPYLDSQHRGQLVDRILHDMPAPPSSVDPLVPHDLETIILTAIAKEPGARYHSAEALAGDLQRFLDDRPILARRSTSTERFLRWCRRNPLVATLTGAVALLLVAAVLILTVSNIQIRREATARAEALKDRNAALVKARQAVDQMLVRVSDSELPAVPQSDELRRQLLGDAITFYHEMLAANADDESLHFEMASVIGKQAQVLRDLGRFDDAFKAADKSNRKLVSMLNLYPDRLDVRRTLSEGLALQGCMANRLGDYHSADKYLQQALVQIRELEARGEMPTEHMLTTFEHLAANEARHGDPDAAITYWNEAIQMAEEALQRDSQNALAHSVITWSCIGIARQPVCSNPEVLLQRAVDHGALFREKGGDEQTLASAWYYLAGYYHTKGEYRRAIDLYKQCWPVYTKACATRATRTQDWDSLRGTVRGAFDAMQSEGNSPEAIQWAINHYTWLKQVEPAVPSVPVAQEAFRATQLHAAEILRSIGEESKADVLTHGITMQSAVERASKHAAAQRPEAAAADFALAIDEASDDWFARSARKSLCRMIADMPEIFPLVTKLRPNESALWVGRAQNLAARSEWDKAKDDYAKAVYSRPIQEEHFEYGGVLLLVGARDDYETFCSEMLDRTGPPNDAYQAYVMARLYLLGPAKCVATSELVEWAERAARDRQAWHQHVLGLAYLRAQKFERAIEAFDESTHMYHNGAIDAGKNFLAMAIAHQRLGRDKIAAELLAHGQNLLKSAGPRRPGEKAQLGPPGEWIAINLLAREAEE